MKKVIIFLLFLYSCSAEPYRRNYIISEERPLVVEEVVYSDESNRSKNK